MSTSINYLLQTQVEYALSCAPQILVPAAAPRYAAPGAPAHGFGTVGGTSSFGSPAEVPQFAGAAAYPPQAASPPQEPTLRLHPGQQLPGTPIPQVCVLNVSSSTSSRSKYGGHPWSGVTARSCRVALLSCKPSLVGQHVMLSGQAAAAELNPDWTPWPVTCQPMRSSPPQTPVMFQVGPDNRWMFHDARLLEGRLP